MAIYAPNNQKDISDFLKSLPNKIKKGDDDFQILIGDYNTTLDPNLDQINYRGDEHTKSREIINSWIMNEDYVDSYR